MRMIAELHHHHHHYHKWWLNALPHQLVRVEDLQTQMNDPPHPPHSQSSHSQSPHPSEPKRCWWIPQQSFLVLTDSAWCDTVDTVSASAEPPPRIFINMVCHSGRQNHRGRKSNRPNEEKWKIRNDSSVQHQRINHICNLQMLIEDKKKSPEILHSRLRTN